MPEVIERNINKQEMKPLLFVDDDTELLEALESLLEGYGISGYFATNSEEALDIVKKEKNLIAFIDIKLKGETGIELIKNIIDLKNISANIKIYAISAWNLNRKEASFLKANNIQFFDKHKFNPLNIVNAAKGADININNLTENQLLRETNIANLLKRIEIVLKNIEEINNKIKLINNNRSNSSLKDNLLSCASLLFGLVLLSFGIGFNSGHFIMIGIISFLLGLLHITYEGKD